MRVTRTTILLDDPSRGAARKLASRFGVSPSEVIRRALVHYQEHVLGPSAEARRKRLAAFDQLCALFEGCDPKAEIARLKQEDAGW